MNILSFLLKIIFSSLTITQLERQKDIHKFQINTKQTYVKDVTYQIEILFDGTLGSDSSSAFYQSTYLGSRHSQQKKLDFLIIFVPILL